MELASGKAVVTQTLNDGDLVIEGYAVVWEGEDRESENFVPGAFRDGVKAFLEGPAALCYHHKTGQVLGKVTALEEVPGGVWMKARVDGSIRTHPELGTYYQQIKAGTLTGLSVGGFFKRRLTPEGPRISHVDLTEVSITGVPVHPRTGFAVTAGKSVELAALLAEKRSLERQRDALYAHELDRIDLILTGVELARLRHR